MPNLKRQKVERCLVLAGWSYLRGALETLPTF